MDTIPFPQFWSVSQTSFQKPIRIVDEPDGPPENFPVVLVPSDTSPAVPDVLEGAKKLAAKPCDASYQSGIRKLLDENGGAVHFKSLPLRTAQDFSQFLDNLSGEGEHAWLPHEPLAMNVLRKVQAKNVLSVNEGPSSHVIMWHNEFSISPSYPSYVVFFCLQPPKSGGETRISSSLAVYNCLKRECPQFLKACVEKGLSYPASHHIKEDSDTFFGNGLYKKSAYGPADGSDITLLPDEEKQHIVEGRIRALAKLGGWSENTAGDFTLPVWQQRGFDWKWRKNGIDVFQRVPGSLNSAVIFSMSSTEADFYSPNIGIRIHPTRKIETLFTALGSRYVNAKNRQTFKPPHKYVTDDGEEEIYLPPMYAGLKADEPIPVEDLDILHSLQDQLAVNIEWEIGDVLVIDNLAVQHSRLPWTGSRKILASFWDQPGMRALPVSTL